MKKLGYYIFFGIPLMFLLVQCTENQRARSFGGTSTIDLPSGQKLVNVTWKGEDMWYLTRPIEEGERPKILTFKEKSNFGIAQGVVVFREHE